MKKTTGMLLVVLLALAACSSPQGVERDDIAALDDGGKTDASGSGGAGKDDKDEGGGKSKPQKGSGGGTKAGGGTGSGGSGSGGGGQGGDGGSGSGGGGGDDAPGAQAAAAAPIPAGRYEYATRGKRSVSGNEEDLPDTTTLTAAGASGDTQRQTRDLRDSDGNGILTDTDLVYRGGDVFLSYVKITSRFQGGLTDVREFRLPRPQLVAPAGSGPGFETAFTMEGSGTRAKVSLAALRYEDVTVGGTKVRALVVLTDIRFSGALEGQQRSTTWFWPKHLLPLREQVHTDVSNGPIRLQSDYEATIERLP